MSCFNNLNFEMQINLKKKTEIYYRDYNNSNFLFLNSSRPFSRI